MSASRLPRFALVLLTLAGAVVACRGSGERRRGLAEREIARGAAFADSLGSAMRDASDPRSVGAPAAIAAGYLERQRLGLGSPFRLIDYALRDPRLGDSLRLRLGWALLARTARGEGSDVDPRALASLGGYERSWAPQAARAHHLVIEQAVASAADPRAGELAVRLAYAVARAEGTVSRQAAAVSAQAAAMARDRALARLDARALLAEAQRGGLDAVQLVAAWRTMQRFTVERPPLEPLSDSAELEALRLAPRVLTDVRAAARFAATSPLPDSGNGDAARSFLGPAAARRLSALASVRSTPPQTPIVVTLRGYQQRLLGRDWLDAGRQERRARFLAQARNEETLASEYALLTGQGAGGATPALAMLSSAVAMRPLAQETPWFPETGGPSVAQLKDRFGLATVSFDREVPPAWRPYYLRQLALGIADLQRVMPALSVRGLGVHFGESGMRDSALALHDPRTRTIYLPLATAGGTLAHELAHDLDWQMARTRLAVRGGYSTDWAVREQRGRLAVSVRGLTAATLIPPLPENGYRPPHSRRPAEVFARNADWFVAAALAREGRSNGYLTSVQDELLTGYAGVLSPGMDGASALAVADVLDDMTFVPPPTRAWFLHEHGRGRADAPYDLVRRVLEAKIDLVGPALLGGAMPALAALPARTGESPVVHESAACEPREERGQRAALEHAIVAAAAEARVRGALRTAAWSGDESGAGLPPALLAVRGGPWAPVLAEDAVARGRDALLAALALRDAAERPFAASAWSDCTLGR